MTNRWLTGWLQAEPWLRVVSFTLAALLLAGAALLQSDLRAAFATRVAQSAAADCPTPAAERTR